MKKIILTLLVVSLLAFVIALSITQSKKKPAKVISLKHSVSITQEAQKQPQETKSKIIISSKTANLTSQPKEILFSEFALPEDLKTILSNAARSGNISNEWGEGKINQGEFQEAGLASGQLLTPALDNKIKNITAGYSLSDKAFTENLNLCLPGKTVEDEQTKELKSQALSAMGFSALMEHKYPQAEEALSALIRDYPETQPAPIAHLELARIFSQAGRFAEARQLVDKATILYNSDKDYLTIAQALKEEMEVNE